MIAIGTSTSCANEYKFECTGRVFYANNYIIGIGPEAGYVSYGSDGGVGCSDDFTPAERVELADYMIRLWQTFKA